MQEDRPIRVLVVDDNEADLFLIGELLADYECEVVTCQDGYEALGLIADQVFHIALVDEVMPGISGLELVRRARPKNPRLQLFVMSGVSNVKVIVEAGKLRAPFLWKQKLDHVLPLILQRKNGRHGQNSD